VTDTILIRSVSFYNRNKLLGEFQHSFIQSKSTKQQCQTIYNPYWHLYWGFGLHLWHNVRNA